jgi:sugar lactone lactonase YvrE
VYFEADSARAEFLDLAADDIAGGAVGILLVEEAAERTLAVCDSDPGNPKASSVVRIDVSDLAQPTPVLTTHALAPSVADGNVFCNDIAADAGGNLYATDSFGGQIMQILAGAADETAATLWKADPALAGNATNPFGANGIVVHGDGTNEFVFVVNFSLGTLHRIAIDPTDGSAGDLVAVALTNGQDEAVTLAGPDGLKVLDADTLLVVENGANSLTKITLSDAFGATPTGKTTVLSSRLDVPTTVAIGDQGESALVVEGQLDHLFDMTTGSPALPFCVSRVQVY